MTLALQVHLVFAVALLLALGFHRHQAAQVSLAAWLMAAAAGSGEPRLLQAALAFGPWLLLLAVAVPEARLLSRRHGVFLGLTAFAVWLTLVAPPRMFDDFRQWLTVDFAAPAVLATVVCLLQWYRSRHPLQLGMAATLLLLTWGCLSGDALPVWFAAAAVCLVLSILWTSYRMAFIDQLTGLPNRRALDETLARLSGNYSLAMVDVDHFKSFNDTYGHDAGDVVLRAVAQSLRDSAGGRTFRYGGEEFCVVYSASQSADAAERLELARERIEAQQISVAAPKKRTRRKTANGKPGTAQVSVTISAGCAPRDAKRRGHEQVLKAADQALYKAKGKGRNRVVMG